MCEGQHSMVAAAASAGVVHAIKWQFQHRYMTLETMTRLSDDPTGSLPNYAIKAA
jgi:hypothetical protein